jgi:LuxR family maltose regulon positive regulatory protein
VDKEFSQYYHLTDREFEILALVVRQYSNQEIASQIGLSRDTVKFHLKSVFGKLGVSTRQKAARSAIDWEKEK